jgi:pentapeptide repeat protein
VPAHDRTLWARPGEPDFTGGHFLGRARFDGAQFTGEARFSGVRFEGPASFRGASFNSQALFDGSHFERTVDFREARFDRGASFASATFADEAWFTDARFDDDVSLERVQAAKYLAFDATSIAGTMRCIDAAFEGSVSLEATKTSGAGDFTHTSFAGLLQLGRAQFDGGLLLSHVQLLTTDQLGPVRAGVVLDATGLSARRAVQLELAAQRVICCAANFENGVELRAHEGDIALDHASFGGPSAIIGASVWPFSTPNETADSGRPRPGPGDKGSKARVVSVRGVNVGELTLVDIDLGPCLFTGAHQLDHLQLQGAVAFTPSPQGLQWKVGWPPLWRWTRRQVLAEEHQYRAGRRRRRRPQDDVQAIGWRTPQSEPPTWLAEVADPHSPLPPARLAVLYRQLRKAQERTPRTSQERPTSTTAKWRCGDSPTKHPEPNGSSSPSTGQSPAMASEQAGPCSHSSSL